MNIKKEKIIPVIFFFSLATIIIFIWFRNGLIYGGGDVGLPTYNPQRIFQVISHIWWEASVPGFPRPQGITGIPFYFLLSSLQKLGLSYVVIQALTFWFVLFLMGLGMYLVSKSVFEKEKAIVPFLSGILYLFNPFMMISVWHRFVHTTFFLAAALPFLFIFWQRWINFGKKTDLLIFALINVLGSIIFGTLGFVISLWIFLTFTSFFFVFFPKKSLAEVKGIILRSVTGFIVWVFILLWWILPLMVTSQAIFSKQHSSADSISTLIVLASQSSIPNTLQGINPFYLFWEKDWGEIYTQWYFLPMPFILVALATLGFIKGLGERKFVFWSLLFLVSIMFAKGAAAPFGGAFAYLFDKFFVLGVLRNPFEKMGIFIPFTYAILIPLGLTTLFSVAKKVKLQCITVPTVSILLVLIVVIWHWPFWQGKLFGNQYNPSEIQVPNYYFEADHWLREQGNHGRILHLPLVVSEATAYKWEYGYRGIEPSQVFFTSNPSLAQGFNLDFLDDALKTLQTFLNNDFINEDEIKQLLKIFGIRYIVLHLDMDTAFMDAYNPDKLKKRLDKFSFLKKQNEFGKLSIYEISEDNPLVYTASSFDNLLMGEKNQFWPWFIKNKNNQLISGINLDEGSIQTDSLILVAISSFDTPPVNTVDEKIELDKLPSVRILPYSPLYNLIRIKEYLETYSAFGKERVSKQILFSSKRLAEAVKIKELDNNNSILGILRNYSNLLDNLLPSLKDAFPYEKNAVDAIFARQSVVLDSLINFAVTENEKEVLVKAKEKLAKNLALWRLRPLYTFNKETSLYNRRIFTFQSPKAGNYEVLFGLEKGTNIEEIFDVALDGKPIIKDKAFVDREQLVNVADFGRIYLDSGYHEFSYRSKEIPVKNLPLNKWSKSEKGEFSERLDEMSISSETNEAVTIQLPLKDFTAGNTYTLQFEYWVQKGQGPLVQLLEDNDPIIKGKREMKANKEFTADIYNRYWQNAVMSFEPRLSANDALIKISVVPWDACETISPIRSACKIREFRKKFERKSTLVIRNVVLKRFSRPEIFLKTSNGALKEATNSGSVEYIRESPSFIRGKFKIDKPQLLVFAETFDQGWKLELFKQGKKINTQNHTLINIYANGWLINEPGEYEFSISFDAQKLVNIGGIISVITMGGIILWCIKR